MTLPAELKSKYRKLKNREKGKSGSAFKAELLISNQTRIKVLGSILTLVFLLFIIFIDIPRIRSGALFTTRGFIWIFAGRLAVVILSTLSFITSSFLFKNIKQGKTFLASFVQGTVITLIFAAFLTNAVGDYLVLGSIETYTGITLAFAVIFFMPDKFSFFYFFSYIQ